MDLLKSIKLERFVDNNLKKYIDINKNIKNTEHLNILLVGPSGVGKSTLINALLKLEKEIVTGFGLPTSNGIHFHESQKVTFLRLAESRGIEKTKESSAEAICQEIQEFMKKQLDTNEPDKDIHCIWYCWTGAILEIREIDIIKELSKQYSLNKIPVIFVYTNTIGPE